MNKRIEFGHYMRDIRMASGLSKFKTSIALGYKSSGTLDSIEQGRGPIPIDKIPQIAKLYNVPLDDFLEKIKEAEPELYNRYMRLKRCFLEEFSEKMKEMSVSIQAAHHRHFFPAERILEGTKDIVAHSDKGKEMCRIFQQRLIMYIM